MSVIALQFAGDLNLPRQEPKVKKGDQIDHRPTVESFILAYGEVLAIRRFTKDVTAMPHALYRWDAISAKIGKPGEGVFHAHQSVHDYLIDHEGKYIISLAERQWMCAWPLSFDKKSGEPERFAGGWEWEEVPVYGEDKTLIANYWQPRWHDVLKFHEERVLAGVRVRMSKKLNLRRF